MSQHTYNLRSKGENDRVKKCRPPPLNISKNQEPHIFEAAFALGNCMGAPLPLGNKKVTKLNNTNISPSFTETPSPKICHKKDNNFIINTSVDSLTSFDYYKYKMKILSEIQKMITILENGFNNNMSFTKSDSLYCLSRYLKEFDIVCEYTQIYAEAKLLILKNDM